MRGVSVYDLLDIVPPPVELSCDLKVNVNDPHPNEEGHRYIAQGMLKLVLARL